jgi:CIC family chloride channel protein
LRAEENIGSALRKMGSRDIGRMPVIERSDPGHLIGLLRRSDLLRAYDLALTRHAADRHRVHQVRLGTFSGGNVQLLEIPIGRGSACDGRRVKEMPWPENCLLTSLRVGHRVIIPHGETILRAGNVLVVELEGKGEDQIRNMCSVPAKQEDNVD